MDDLTFGPIWPGAPQNAQRVDNINAGNRPLQHVPRPVRRKGAIAYSLHRGEGNHIGGHRLTEILVLRVAPGMSGDSEQSARTASIRGHLGDLRILLRFHLSHIPRI